MSVARHVGVVLLAIPTIRSSVAREPPMRKTMSCFESWNRTAASQITGEPPQSYQVRVMTMYGGEISSSVASVGPYATPFEIRVPSQKLSQAGTGVVSLQQLQHTIPKQAQKLLDKGDRSFRDRNFQQAGQQFREAVKDDPQCMQAHAQPSLTLARQGHWQEAVGEYRLAADLDPKNSMPHSNLSAALASSGNLPEAASEAQSALKLDSRNPRAHFVLTGVMLKEQASLREVVPHLVAAQDAFPSARTALQKLCAQKDVAGCPR